MSERQAQELLQQAEKKLNGWSWFGGGNKEEEAAEIYEKAGNTFKLAQRWPEAADAFMKAAELYKKIPDERYEASKAFENAAKCLKRNDAEGAVKALQEAITIDKDGANFRNAAKHHQEIAEIYESDVIDLQGAMDNWDAAAHLYMADDSQAMVNKCLLKVAHFAAQLEQYDSAIEKFETVATNSVDNQLTKWSLKEYFLKAGLCYLCTQDTVRTRQALDKYVSMDLSFESTREYQFLQSILECVENGEVEIFTHKVYEFDQLTKLDNWKTTMLLRIKRTIAEEPSLL
ncbi:soluble NSF attachment protein [Radiomyces spectabilis]|uniref:soluble NSF attachment protein n=1 Tax=Radiomyces spectabilis TaxID=64574 RepID=UPI0022207AD6|nr:soluble NSF attachment protein [Radiomyces spectabilis]KAI8368306.1 soluble NSF attachment protein [Radiomyces spectabilis]